MSRGKHITLTLSKVHGDAIDKLLMYLPFIASAITQANSMILLIDRVFCILSFRVWIVLLLSFFHVSVIFLL